MPETRTPVPIANGRRAMRCYPDIQSTPAQGDLVGFRVVIRDNIGSPEYYVEVPVDPISLHPMHRYTFELHEIVAPYYYPSTVQNA